MTPIDKKQQTQPTLVGDMFPEILSRADDRTVLAFCQVSKNLKELASREFVKRNLPKPNKGFICVCVSKIRIEMDKEIISDLRQKIYSKFGDLSTSDKYCYSARGTFNGKKMNVHFFNGAVKSMHDTMIFSKFDAIVYPLDFASSDSEFNAQVDGIKLEINRNSCFFTAKQFVIGSSEENQEREKRIENEIPLPCIKVKKDNEYFDLINNMCVRMLVSRD